MPITHEGRLLQRTPWRQLGWYTFAVAWIDQQLSSASIDHRGHRMQRDGPMHQIHLSGTYM